MVFIFGGSIEQYSNMYVVKNLNTNRILKELKNSGHYYGALLYVFCISFHQQVATFSLIIWLLLSLFSYKSSSLVKNRFLLLLPFLYVTYFIGTLPYQISEFRFLETKLSFLAFPLIFFLNTYSIQKRNKMLKFLVLGLVVSSILCLTFAFYKSIHIEDGGIYLRANVLAEKGFTESILYGGNYFFGRYLSIFHQTVYFALYLSSGIAILCFVPKIFEIKIRVALLIFFCIMIFLVSNKASFIVLAILFSIRLFTLKTGVKKKAFGSFLILIFFSFFLLVNPRAKESMNKIWIGELELNKNARYGFSTRLLSWNAALALIKENPISGYGADKTQQRLNEMYSKKEYKYPLKEKYNAHNQGLQIWLENGLLGILVFISIFLVVFNSSIKLPSNSMLYITLVIALFTNAMFESMFNRFSGISFFSFIVCFIFSMHREGESKS
jgi:O-antigen ligase